MACGINYVETETDVFYLASLDICNIGHAANLDQFPNIVSINVCVHMKLSMIMVASSPGPTQLFYVAR